MTGTIPPLGLAKSPAGIAQDAYQLTTDAYGSPAPLVNPGRDPGSRGPADIAPALPTRGSAVLMASLAELDQARQAYAVADQMYDGEIGDLPVSPHMARLLAKAGINDIEDLNYAAVPVDAITEKLGIRAVTITPKLAPGQEPTDEQKLQAERLQDILDAIRDENELDIEEDELFLRASKYGDGYLEVWPASSDADGYDDELMEPDADPDDPNAQVATGGADPQVAIYVNSPYAVRAFYSPESPRDIAYVLKAWDWCDPNEHDAKPRARATLYTKEAIERWICKPDGDPRRAEDWIPVIEDGEPWPAPYPDGVDRIPFFHFRNRRPYGSPEHRKAYGPQRIINKIVSAEAVSIDFQIFPQRYLLTDPRVDQTLMNYINPDNPDDEDDDPEAEGHSQLRADPAAVWRLTASQVGQFQPADPATFLTPLDRYIRSIAELCGIPLDRFTGYSTPPSGESRRVGSEVLYEKVGARRRRYGRVLEDAYTFALHLAGIEDVSISVKWEPLAVATGTDDWAVVSSKIANGVPVKQALVEAGYPEEEVDQWLLDQGGADLVRRVALLNSIATAVTGLAAGVGVGLVSHEQAGDLVARVIGEINQDLPDLENPVTLNPPQPPGQPGLPGMPPPPPPRQQGTPNDGPPPAQPAQAAPAAPPAPPAPPAKPVQVGVGPVGGN